MVILRRCDDVEKMNKTLSDDLILKGLGATIENINTAKIETRLQKQLLELTKKDEPRRSVYKVILPAPRPSRYELPKNP